ncbi:MAG: benzoyl-CoA-dihydrodiol lyase [Planctomycetes bacterium]|nr:benzoyl-CoA-dihydrodiol lyase [Planctomycetota bacterium]
MPGTRCSEKYISHAKEPVISTAPSPRTSFQTHPTRYKHWRLRCEGELATLTMAVQASGGERPGYELKLNSYDLSVDIELADAAQRLVFEHPEVRCVVLTGALERVFCAGANIGMLATSTHAFKVNFCKYTNETRLYLEDASACGGKRFLAALNGTASGGGYELALACDRILLVDDRSSAVSFPELPLLGVLPGTGGLTRVSDKRKVRKDRADVFASVAEGVKGKRAVEWNLVDALAPLSKWKEEVARHAAELAREVVPRTGKGVELASVECAREGEHWKYTHVAVAFERAVRTARLTLTLPSQTGPKDAAAARAAGSGWWLFQLFRELDDALVNLRFHEPEIGLVLVRVVGDPAVALAADAVLTSTSDWFVREVAHYVKRVLKRVENTAKSFYAVADAGSAFAGTFLELFLACDRSYLLADDAARVTLGVSGVHAGLYPMANGLTRLQTRFLAEPRRVQDVLAHAGRTFEASTADELGLATFAPDALDWDDELRLAVEERASFSPDALTGMEQNVRPCGPETMETKIFGRLSAWQNWIFQRPNAVGEKGALKCYGTPLRPEFDFRRT